MASLKQRKRDALLKMQGGQRYNIEEEQNFMNAGNYSENQDFQFNHRIAPYQTFQNFYAAVIRKNMRLDDGLDKISNMQRLKMESIERVKGRISTFQESSKPSPVLKTEKKKKIDHDIRVKEQIEHKNRQLMSDEAKRLDSLFREVVQISGSVAMNLVATRQKLQPFVSEGVVYKDRKKRQDDDGTKDIISGSKLMENRVNQKIKVLKKDIRKHLKYKRIKELERILDQLTEYDKNNAEAERIYTLMRLDITQL